jgi:hypothetical protein
VRIILQGGHINALILPRALSPFSRAILGHTRLAVYINCKSDASHICHYHPALSLYIAQYKQLND